MGMGWMDGAGGMGRVGRARAGGVGAGTHETATNPVPPGQSLAGTHLRTRDTSRTTRTRDSELDFPVENPQPPNLGNRFLLRAFTLVTPGAGGLPHWTGEVRGPDLRHLLTNGIYRGGSATPDPLALGRLRPPPGPPWGGGVTSRERWPTLITEFQTQLSRSWQQGRP